VAFWFHTEAPLVRVIVVVPKDVLGEYDTPCQHDICGQYYKAVS
jgi:hypothetical protein